jgi:hypothetical protein
MLNVCATLIPGGEPMHSEGVAQIMKPRLVSSVAPDADMLPQPKECIFQNKPLYPIAALVGEERLRPIARLAGLTPIVVVFGEYLQQLTIQCNASAFVALCRNLNN